MEKDRNRKKRSSTHFTLSIKQGKTNIGFGWSAPYWSTFTYIQYIQIDVLQVDVASSWAVANQQECRPELVHLWTSKGMFAALHPNR